MNFKTVIIVLKFGLLQFVFAMTICAARAGLIGGLGYGHGAVAVAAPVAIAAPAVAISHGASSYQNSNLLALNPTAVVTKVAAPVAIAAPVLTKIAAPVAVAAPLAVAPLGLGLGKFFFIYIYI